jgi:hypothetical protein
VQDEKDGSPGDRDDNEAETDSSTDAAAEREAAPKRSGGKKSSSKRRAVEAARAEANSRGFTTALVVGALALAVGGAAGWFGHDAQAKAKLRADSAAPAGSGAASGPCGAWQKKICDSTGDVSASCSEAKAALDLLTPSTCEVALAGVPATLAKVKAARASCDKLVAKLCADLPPGSSTCKMVTERTPSFPAARCEEMLGQYDAVIGELKQMDQQGGPPGMAPPGMPPQGAAPGEPPPGHP